MLVWVTPTTRGDIIISRRSLNELGINIISAEKGQQPNEALERVPMKSIMQPQICDELACYMEEFLELRIDSKRFNLRPETLLYITRSPGVVDSERDPSTKLGPAGVEDVRKAPRNVVHATLDLIHVRGYIPFPAWGVEGTLVPCPANFGYFAVFENGNREREIPLETRGYQIFHTQWGLG